jgi:hypothetical protein
VTRISAGVAAVAAAAVTAAVVMPSGLGAPARQHAAGGVVLDAATVLHRAAAAAVAEPSPRGDQFLYSQVRYITGLQHAPVDTHRELGVRQRHPAGSPAGRRRVPGRVAVLGEVPATKTNYAWLRSLPKNPAALLTYLEHVKTCSFRNWTSPPAYLKIYSIFGSLSQAPPAASAALLNVAARIPGTSVLPHVKDMAGGQGIAVAMTQPWSFNSRVRVELIFNPHSYHYVGEQVVLVHSTLLSIAPGTVIHATAVLRLGVSDTAPTNYTIYHVPGHRSSSGTHTLAYPPAGCAG